MGSLLLCGADVRVLRYEAQLARISVSQVENARGETFYFVNSETLFTLYVDHNTNAFGVSSPSFDPSRTTRNETQRITCSTFIHVNEQNSLRTRLRGIAK